MTWVSVNTLLSTPFVVGWIALPLWMALKHPWWVPSRYRQASWHDRRR
jgi:hypothetical protein